MSGYFSPKSIIAPSFWASSLGISVHCDRHGLDRPGVDLGLDLCELLGREGLVEVEVEAEQVGLDLRALLVRLRAQRLPQGVLQQVRGRVGAANGLPPRRIDRRLDRVLVFDPAGAKMADVQDEIVLDPRVGHFEAALGPDDPARVAHLPAHLAVERRAIEHDHRGQLAVELVELVGKLVIDQQAHHHGLGRFGFVAHELARLQRLADLVQRPLLEQFLPLPGAGGLFVLLLGLLEAVPIEFQAAFHGQRLGQFRREAVGLQEIERLAAGNDLGLRLLRLFEEPLHPRHAGVDHLEELAFLVPQALGHALDRLLQLGVGALHQVGHDLGKLIQERLVDAHLVAVQHGPADQLADHVALLLVVGIDVLVDGEGAGPHVVGDAPQAAAVVSVNFAVAFGPVLHAADLAGRLDQRAEDVDVVVGLHALQHGGHAFEAHARVDVLAGQRAEVVGRRADAVELREDQVPDLDRSAGRGDVDFAARPAHAVGPLAGALAGQKFSSSSIRFRRSGGSLTSLSQILAASSSSR